MTDVALQKVIVLVIGLLVLGATLTLGGGAVDTGHSWLENRFEVDKTKTTTLEVPGTSCIGAANEDGFDLVNSPEDHDYIEKRLTNGGCGKIENENYEPWDESYSFKKVELDVEVGESIRIEQETCFELNQGNNLVDVLTGNKIKKKIKEKKLKATIARFYAGSRNDLKQNSYPYLYEARSLPNNLRIGWQVWNSGSCMSTYGIKYMARWCDLEPGKYRYTYYYRVIDNTGTDDYNPHMMVITSLD